jgi:hypothetical protein
MMVRLTLLFLTAVVVTGCSTSEVKIAHSVPLQSVSAPYAESELLDLAVVVFDSGVPEGELDREVIEELMRDGTFVQIRRAEAMFLAVKLRETLQNSGHWGSVWVTPQTSTAVDLNIHGQILRSDGNIVELKVWAEDGTGRVWFVNDYEMETAASAYNRQRYPDLDPYQDVLNEIANDLASYRAGLDAETVADIRTIGELRYASELSPEAFGEYLSEDDGVFEPQRLPAAGDPTLQRSRSVRQREQLFFETLDRHYEEFMLSAADSYDSWREYSREDSLRIQEAARAARLRTGLGALAIAMSIAYGAQSDRSSLADRIIADAGIYVGGDLLRSAAVRRQERRLHTQSLQELSEDFEDSVEPLVVEIQGTQHRLTGSAAAQYEEWQGLIRELFISETGFVPEDIELYAEPAEDGDDIASPDAASAPASGSEIQEATSDAGGGTEADA